jgi:DNA-binding NarL/FixJ family response regulator
MDSIQLMIVDDSEAICLDLGKALELTAAGLEIPIRIVTTALDGQDAIDKADVFLPDLIMMDLEMPGLGGLTAARRIKEKHPGLPILAFTIHDSPATQLAVTQAKMDGLISKGTSLLRIVEEINRICSLFSEKQNNHRERG